MGRSATSTRLSRLTRRTPKLRRFATRQSSKNSDGFDNPHVGFSLRPNPVGFVEGSRRLKPKADTAGGAAGVG